MHEEALGPVAVDVLRSLMGLESLGTFSLGGGTNLALRHGHRVSVDLDWFSGCAFESLSLQEDLRERFEGLEVVNRTAGSLCCLVRGVKLDFLLHAYPRLRADDSVDGCRMVSVPDIAAMKINAVTNRGSKKDFSDLLLLHESGGVGVGAALDLFCAKYGDAGRALALRSLIWFEDAEAEPDPLYLNGWTWDQIRRKMSELGEQLCRENGL